MEDYAEDLREKLLTIESESGIFEWKVAGIRLWQYMRWFCLVEIIHDITGLAERSYIRKNEGTQKQAMRIGEWVRRQQFFLSSKDLVVLNHPRRVKAGAYYRCFVTETLLENLDCSYYVFEDEYYGKHFKPTKTKNLKYIDMDVIRKAFKLRNEDTDREIRVFYNRVMRIFENDNGIKLSAQTKKRILDYLIRKYYEIRYRTIWAKIVFSLVRPKALIVTSPFSPDAQAVIVEAKRRNIATIELQHGICPSHIAYNYLYQGKVDIFPDYLFVYGKFDRDIPRYPVDRKRIIPVGYPDLEQKAEFYKKLKKDGQKVLLFISSDEGTTVPEYAVELRKRQELKDIRMIYKLHPDEYEKWKSTYPQLVNSGLEIISENRHDIYYYLGHSDYVVGTSSTALYEASAFQTDIYIIRGGDYRMSRVLYENGYAQLVTDVDMLAEKILHPVADRKNTKSYFEKNAIANMKRELDKIMNCKSIPSSE